VHNSDIFGVLFDVAVFCKHVNPVMLVQCAKPVRCICTEYVLED